jgi:uncharacterized protein
VFILTKLNTGGKEMLTTEQKFLAALCHGGTFLAVPILLPLIIMLISSDPYVRTQAKEALIFQIGLVIGFIVSGILVIVIVGIIGLVVLGILALVMPIIAIIKVLEGHDYSYPVTGKYARNL